MELALVGFEFRLLLLAAPPDGQSEAGGTDFEMYAELSVPKFCEQPSRATGWYSGMTALISKVATIQRGSFTIF